MPEDRQARLQARSFFELTGQAQGVADLVLLELGEYRLGVLPLDDPPRSARGIRLGVPRGGIDVPLQYATGPVIPTTAA